MSVDLSDFDDEDVIERGLELANDEELKKELTDRGFIFKEAEPTVERDIVSQSLIDRFLEGFDKINREELEEFLNRQGV